MPKPRGAQPPNMGRGAIPQVQGGGGFKPPTPQPQAAFNRGFPGQGQPQGRPFQPIQPENRPWPPPQAQQMMPQLPPQAAPQAQQAMQQRPTMDFQNNPLERGQLSAFDMLTRRGMNPQRAEMLIQQPYMRGGR